MSASADHVTAKTLESEIGPHARYSGGVGYPTPDGPQSGEALLIFGPGEAKLQLKERLSRSKALAERIAGIETTDKPDPQIVAKVKEHYGIEPVLDLRRECGFVRKCLLTQLLVTIRS